MNVFIDEQLATNYPILYEPNDRALVHGVEQVMVLLGTKSQHRVSEQGDIHRVESQHRQRSQRCVFYHRVSW